MLGFLFTKGLLCFLGTIRYMKLGNGKMLWEKEYGTFSASRYCERRIVSLLLVHYKPF